MLTHCCVVILYSDNSDEHLSVGMCPPDRNYLWGCNST